MKPRKRKEAAKHGRMCWIVAVLLLSGSDAFLPQHRRQDHLRAASIGPPSPFQPTTTQLFENKLWDRLQIEEDPEPFWYLLNCVAGLEMNLLAQCRETCKDMPDAIKFVVPTETKTRSHGANRMVTETKVKYQGYVFAKLRLCPEVYEAIQGLDLCRSWMGTVNHMGYKKLPPAPVALNEMEIENFGLEGLEWKDEEPRNLEEEDVILDEEGVVDKNAVDQQALKAFLGLRVNDMVKVTKRCKFYDEDATVRRLKDGKILLRFFTYGTMFEEWMDPGDVRKLTELEIMKGLSGPSEPIGQYEFDNPGRRDRDRDGPRSRRQDANSFGSRGDLMGNVKGSRFGGLRNRRQDRVGRGQQQRRDFFGRTEEERTQEARNWDWYKDQRRNKEGMVSDDEFTYRPGSRGRDNGDDAMGIDDAQWGRPMISQRQKRRENKGRQQEDWSTFVSPASSPSKSSSREEDDFFASLMNDLTKDASKSPAPSGSSDTHDNEGFSSTADEDDFFASLVADINDDNEEKSDRPKPNQPKEEASSLYTDDFFASLAGNADDSGADQGKSDLFDEDELFGSFDGKGDEDDYFASLEQELGSSLGSKDGQGKPDDFFAKVESSLDVEDARSDESGDDFFASLEANLASELEVSDNLHNSNVDVPTPAEVNVAEETGATPPLQETYHPAPSHDAAGLSKLTVAKLKEMLKERGLKVSGKKAELIERLSA